MKKNTTTFQHALAAKITLLFLSLYSMVGFAISQNSSAKELAQVVATIETSPVPSSGDAADDPAIWIHPSDPALSLILGTDKGGGLAVYDLGGVELQYLADGQINNVDLRYNFRLGATRVPLVTAGNRSDSSIAIYTVDAITRRLQRIAARLIKTGIEVYGSCMYRSPYTGKYYFFANSKNGEVEQWELYDSGNGKVSAILVREFSVGSQTEGCVADDVLGFFYIGEESTAIWKYGAEPDSGISRTQVDSTGAGGHLTADVEGLTLYYAQDGEGYLVASSQGSNEFVIYLRGGSNEYVMTFQVVAGNGIDAVTGTDGIDVVNFPLGTDFHQGVFVAQDTSNDDGNQNYKLIPWGTISAASNPALIVDTTWDPRLIGAEETVSKESIFIPMILGE